MIAWGITYLVHSSLLIAAVWIASRFVRSASARETLWKLALVAPLLTASLQLAWPKAAPARLTLPAPAIITSAVPAAPTAETAAPQRPAPAPLHTTFMPDVRLLWLAAAALMLLRLAGGRVLFARALRDRIDLLREHDRLARLRSAMGCRADVRLTESAAVGSPIAMHGREIVVPRATFARLSDEQKDTILAHELAHLVRRDPLWLLLGELIKAALPIQPLNWIAQRKMKECAEFLCDDLAVLHTRNPRALAETLAELATSYAPAPRAVAAMAEGGSNLMARVARVLTEAQRERPLRLGARVAIASVTVIALAAFGPGVISSTMPGKTMPRPGTMHFADGILSRTFDGPEGETKVRMTARNADVAEDASSFGFSSRDGFLHIQHTASNGPDREIDVTPGRNLAPVTHYRVGGLEQPWDESARRVVLSAFRAEKAYAAVPATAAKPATKAFAPHDAIRVTAVPRTPAPGQKLKRWDGTISLTGTRDGVPTSLSILASGVRYDLATGEVFFDESASLYVEERVDDDVRSFRRDARDLIWSGSFGRTEVSSWLARILHEQTKLPMDVAEAMGRE